MNTESVNKRVSAGSVITLNIIFMYIYMYITIIPVRSGTPLGVEYLLW